MITGTELAGCGDAPRVAPLGSRLCGRLELSGVSGKVGVTSPSTNFAPFTFAAGSVNYTTAAGSTALGTASGYTALLFTALSS